MKSPRIEPLTFCSWDENDGDVLYQDDKVSLAFCERFDDKLAFSQATLNQIVSDRVFTFLLKYDHRMFKNVNCAR